MDLTHMLPREPVTVWDEEEYFETMNMQASYLSLLTEDNPATCVLGSKWCKDGLKREAEKTGKLTLILNQSVCYRWPGEMHVPAIVVPMSKKMRQVYAVEMHKTTYPELDRIQNMRMERIRKGGVTFPPGYRYDKQTDEWGKIHRAVSIYEHPSAFAAELERCMADPDIRFAIAPLNMVTFTQPKLEAIPSEISKKAKAEPAVLERMGRFFGFEKYQTLEGFLVRKPAEVVSGHSNYLIFEISSDRKAITVERVEPFGGDISMTSTKFFDDDVRTYLLGRVGDFLDDDVVMDYVTPMDFCPSVGIQQSLEAIPACTDSLRKLQASGYGFCMLWSLLYTYVRVRPDMAGKDRMQIMSQLVKEFEKDPDANCKMLTEFATYLRNVTRPKVEKRIDYMLAATGGVEGDE